MVGAEFGHGDVIGCLTKFIVDSRRDGYKSPRSKRPKGFLKAKRTGLAGQPVISCEPTA